MKVLRAFLRSFVFGAVLGLLVSVSTANAAMECSLLFQSDVVADLRAEILAANLRDRARSREGAAFSNFIQGRAVDFAIVDRKSENVISLGSGPDVFLPLYLFPTAHHIRLVDGLGGWGRGPDHVLSEIEARLHAIALDANVERVDRQGDWSKITGPLQGPITWRVRWTSPSAGLQERLVSLHQGDFNQVATLEPALVGGLAGIVVTGAVAKSSTYAFLLSRLSMQGVLFAEFWPEQSPIVANIATFYHVVDHGQPAALKGAPFVPRTFEFRRTVK